jgi:hypothetical protein
MNSLSKFIRIFKSLAHPLRRFARGLRGVTDSINFCLKCLKQVNEPVCLSRRDRSLSILRHDFPSIGCVAAPMIVGVPPTVTRPTGVLVGGTVFWGAAA